MITSSLRNSSIRRKLRFINCLLLLTCAILIGFTFYAQYQTEQSYAESEQHKSILNSYHIIESKIIAALIVEKDFAVTHDETLIDQHEQLLQDAKAELAVLHGNDVARLDGEGLATVGEAVNQYELVFKELVTMMYENGLDHNSGLLGGLRKAVHEVEGVLNSEGEISLAHSMLMMRRHEKDYLARKLDKYLDQMHLEHKRFLTLLDQQSELSGVQRYHIQELINDYIKKFFLLVQGVKQFDQKNILFHATAEKIKTLLEKQSSLSEEKHHQFEQVHRELESNIYLLQYLLLGFILLGVLPMSVLISRSIAKSTSGIAEMVQDIADGEADLTKRLTVQSHDEMGKVSIAFNAFMEKLQVTLNDINDLSQHLYRTSMTSQQMTDKTNEAIRVEVAAIERIAESIEEMTQSVSVVADGSQRAAQTANGANENALKGANVVEFLIKNIDNLAGDVSITSNAVLELTNNLQSIDVAVDMIMEISDQTNLLALNAAIEAARAGDQGRGFAVVADEVRNLAQRTTTASFEIKKVVDQLQQGSDVANKAMASSTQKATESVEQSKQAGVSLQAITESVAMINQMNAEIATAALQQSDVAEHINNNIVSVSNAVNDLAETAKQSISDGGDLSQTATLLQTLTARFGQLKGEHANEIVEDKGHVSQHDHDVELF